MHKKTFIALAAAGALSITALTACSESSTEPRVSKAQQCGNGLSAECLVGAWDALGFANKGTMAMLNEFDYSANPGKLTFQPDGSFTFDFPSTVPAALVSDPDCNPIRGSWSVDGTVLTLSSNARHFDTMQMCLGTGTTLTLVPEIDMEAVPGSVRLSFGEILLMGKATNEKSIKDYSTEIFTISAF